MAERGHMNIPIFIPHKGCPNKCVFCDQRSIAGQTGEVTGADVQRIVEAHLQSAGGKTVEIAFFGGSFTGLPAGYQKELLHAAREYVRGGFAAGIRLSTRPDYIDEGRLSLLREYGVATVELGVQSMDEDVLLKSGRGHTREDVIGAAALVRDFGMRLGLQMMTGLPGDDDGKSLLTAREMVFLKPDFVRIYPTLVIRGTPLEALYLRGEYIPQTLEGAVALAARLTLLFEGAGIRVIRTGLQAGEGLSGDLVAGPYHSAFGEMVKSRVFRDEIERYIKESGALSITVSAPANKVSQIIGNKRSNILYLTRAHNVKINIVKNDGPFTISG